MLKTRRLGPKPRRCKYCKLTFVPTATGHNAEIQRFCCRKHKQAYHRNGSMNMERLEQVVIAAVKKTLLADDQFLDKLRDKLRVVPDEEFETSGAG